MSQFFLKKINFNHKVTFNTFNFYFIIDKIILEVIYLIYLQHFGPLSLFFSVYVFYLS